MLRFLATAILLLAFCASVSAQGNRKIKVGKPAPELHYPNPGGEKIKLSEICKDRIVLLDFWASWCGPCRYANPQLVAMYNHYKGLRFKGAPLGFTVVSVSLDNSLGMWRLAIQQDGLLWPYHMADIKNAGDGPAKKYGVQYIPQAFLIGPDGVVIGKYDEAVQAASDLDRRLER